ncbi:TAXI family TRAP transporter solute-binding subunit [Chloroflexota bacterium]
MKKVVYILLAVLLLVGLGLSACAEPAPAPTPAQKILRTEVRTTSFGGSSYVLGFAGSDILNKKSAWIRCSALESTGSIENIKIVGDDAKKRARSFFITTGKEFVKARAGVDQYKENPQAYQDIMMLLATTRVGYPFLTLDPNIKNIADLKGKRVAVFPKGTSKYLEAYNTLAGAGQDVVDSIKFQYTGYGGVDDMILGKTDAVPMSVIEGKKDRFHTIPVMKELMAKKPELYIVGCTPEQRLRSKELFGEIWGASFTILPDNFAPGIPDEPRLCSAVVLGWAIYPDVPEDVVYEIVRTLYENRNMFPEYHPGGVGLADGYFGLFPMAKKYWHPGARKYYDEMGIGYGTEYFYEEYPLK